MHDPGARPDSTPERSLLREAAHERSTGETTARILQKIVDGARAVVSTDGAFLERVEADRGEVVTAARSGSCAPAIGTRVPYPGSLAEEVIGQAEPEILESGGLFTRQTGGELPEACRDHSALVMPLISEGWPVGALALLRSPDRPPFSRKQADRLSGLIDIATLAISRSLLLEESEVRAAELEESERRFRLVVDAVRDYAIVMLDPEGRIRTWNTGAERIQGYAADDVVGRHFEIFHTEENRAREHPAHGLAVAEREGRHQEEGWRVRKDGSRFWAHVLITPIRRSDGTLLGFSNVTRDLTERRRLEEARRREAARYRAVYEDTPSINITSDRSGVIVAVNRYGAEYLGYRVEDLVGRPLLDFVHEEDRPAVTAHAAWCFEHPGRVHTIEFRKLGRKAPLWVHETARAVEDPDGGLVLLNVCDDIEARVQAEAERARILASERAAHERVEQILESITDAFFAVDRTGRFVYLNRAARGAVERLLGRSPGEVVGSQIWETFPQLRGGRLEERVRRALSEQRPVNFEEYVSELGGWFEVRAYPAQDGLSVYLRDITARKQAEAAMRESEAKLRQIAEQIREVLWISQPGFERVLYVNPAYQEVFGRSPDTLLEDATSVFESIHPADREEVERTVAAMDEEETDLEYRAVRPDGEVRWIRSRSFPVRDEHGVVQRVVGIAEDMTERKNTEETYRFLLDAGRILGSSLDFEQTLTNVARLAVSGLADWCVIDLSEGDEIHRVTIETSDPEKVPIAEEYMRLYPPDPEAATGGPYSIRTGESQLLPDLPDEALRAVSRDARQLRILRELGFRSAMAVPLRVDDRILGAITFISSRADRRYGAEDLRAAELLAHRAALAVEKARLYREARKATRLRDDVLSVVSHDLRNPLNTVLMSTALLCETLPEEENRAVFKQLRIIYRAAKQGSRLIEDLLDIARIEAGRLSLQLRPRPPALLMEDACDGLRALAEEKELRLECEPGDDLPDVHADRDRVLQIFGNLIGNAVKFTAGGGRITVAATVESEGPEGEAVRFSVSDTGAGIPSGDIPRLFDRFFQATHARRAGAGLGLAISRGLVEAHGGRIWVESVEGEGSTFHFTLRCAEIPASPE